MKGGRRERKKKKITAGFGASQIQASSWHHTNILQQILDPKPRSFPTSSFHKILADQHQQHKKSQNKQLQINSLQRNSTLKGHFLPWPKTLHGFFWGRAGIYFFFPCCGRHITPSTISLPCSSHSSALHVHQHLGPCFGCCSLTAGDQDKPGSRRNPKKMGFLGWFGLFQSSLGLFFEGVGGVWGYFKGL